MLRTLGLVVLILSCTPAVARPQWSLGTGLETRMQREVNPDYTELKAMGQLFAQVQFSQWAAHTELAEERQESSAGALSISSRTVNFGLWGRYRFLEQKNWRPFAAGGAGAYFDRVVSEFNSLARDERSGVRPYWGLGGGIGVVFWKHLLTELEGRATLVRDRKEPMVSALLRVGFAY